jgi:phosphoglycolate phosphatase
MAGPERRIRAIILDLDGTLVDSAGEIAAALNNTLYELGQPSLPIERVQALIGRGVRSLVERALAGLHARADVDAAIARFEAHYALVVGTEAKLFEGVLPGLEHLHAMNHPLAVVTNKPRAFTVALLERLGIDRFFTAIVSGDDGIRRKPHGDMLVAACDRMGTARAETLMLGDSENDVAAARAAGCPVWCVPYGYNEGKSPDTLDCDRIVPSIDAAARLIGAGLQP